MSPLHDALRELADEVDAAPEGLAERAWATGRGDLHRERRTRVVATITAAAAAVLVLWVALMSGLGRSDSAPAEPDPDDVTQVVTGYPQRVVDPGAVEPLPAKGVPLTAVIHSRARPDGGGWLALRPDGSLFSLPGLLPQQLPAAGGDVTADDARQHLPLPALDPTGRWIAAFEAAGGDRPRLVVIDVLSGARRTHEWCAPPAGAQLHWSPGSTRVATRCPIEDSATDDTALISSVGPTDEVPTDHSVILEGPCTNVKLAGWSDVDHLLTACVRRASGRERLHLAPIPMGRATPATSPMPAETRGKPVGKNSPMIAEAARDEANLFIRGTTLEICLGGVPGEAAWLGTRDLTSVAGVSHVRAQRSATLQEPMDVGRMTRLHGYPGVTLYTSSGLATMDWDAPDQEPVTLMVIDPALRIDAASVADESVGGSAKVSRLGTRTAWWTWHLWETTLVALGLGALVTVGAVASRRRGWWSGPSGPALITTAALGGAFLAAIVIFVLVQDTTSSSDPPTPDHEITVG